MERPLEERREITEGQAEVVRQHYEVTIDERGEIHGGDIVEYNE